MKLVIANIEIHQDAEGRYSLNDLHKAAGAEERHQPALFVRLEQTQALITEISNSTDSQSKNPLDSKSGRYGGSYGAKELVYAYAMWISPKFHLQVIRTFDEVATGKVGAGRTTTLTRNQVAAGILLLRSAAEDLRFAPSAVLGGYQRLEAQLGITGLLPAYAVDAPKGSTTGSSEAPLSATELLKRHGVEMSSISFNRLLVNAGFLEEKTRPSSKGGEKSFKSVTDLEYGKNETSPNNPRETQPLWYPSKFAELLERVMPAKLEAVV